MKTKRNFFVVFATMFAIVAFSTVAWAGPSPKPKPPVCSLVGTWSGSADSSTWASSHLAWTSVVTADSSSTSGEIVLSWVPFWGDLSYLFGVRAGAPNGQWVSGRLNPGQGVWQLNGGVYSYTWYAYYVAYDPTGAYPDQVVYSVRVFGTVNFPTAGDCNDATMSYTLEGYLGLITPQDMTEDNVDYKTVGADNNELAYETKVPLVAATTP